MKIFTVLFTDKSDAGRLAVEGKYPKDHIAISDRTWLVSDTGTAQEVCEKLEALKGEKGSVIVMSTNGYFGWAPNNIWEWIKTKMEAPSSG